MSKKPNYPLMKSATVISARQSGKSTAVMKATLNSIGINFTAQLQCKECVAFYYRDAHGWKSYCNTCHIHREAPHLMALAFEVRMGKGKVRMISWSNHHNAIVVMKEDEWMWREIDGERFHEYKP